MIEHLRGRDRKLEPLGCALDCSGPIRKTRCLRGEGGVRIS